jgi:hypothetical protein
MEGIALTPTDLLAAASAGLEEGGYARVEEAKLGAWPISGARLYEDAYSIVTVIVYETWAELESGWPDAQGALVELMSAHMTSADAKSWEGYLVLLTPGSSPAATDGVSAIRYDTSRVRKLVATGDELKRLSDVERALLPLLPLAAAIDIKAQSSVLDLLPDLLASKGIDRVAVEVVIGAFREQQPLLERLHEYGPAA